MTCQLAALVALLAFGCGGGARKPATVQNKAVEGGGDRASTTTTEPPTAFVPPAECLELKAAMQAHVNCRPLTREQRDAFMHDYDVNAANWARMRPEEMPAVAIACAHSADEFRRAPCT